MLPNNTKYSTKWAVNAFTAWQNTRVNDSLASIPMPETTVSSTVNNIWTSSVFNYCTISFVDNK